MSKSKRHINGYTPKEAADVVGDLSDSRIRQLAAADEIDHEYFGRALVITDKGIEQLRSRKRKPGPAAVKANGRKPV